MATDNFDSFAETCERFGNIAQYDAAHLDVVGAFHRLAELHKRELAAKDAEIEELQRTLDLHDLHADEECEDADVARIVAEGEAAAKDAEIAKLRERIKAAEEFAAEMKKSTNSLVRACGHQMILRLREEGVEDEGK